MPDDSTPSNPADTRPAKRAWRVAAPIPAILVGAVVVVALGGSWLHHHAQGTTSHSALSSSPKSVTVVRAQAASFQPSHRYVGTLRPWIEARVGPQFVSAYVSTVLVRPGDVVQRGQVLATLDCRDVSARSKSIELQARALQSEQVALSAQAARETRLLDGGYISANDVEQQTAQSAAEQSKLEAQRATLVDSRLAVDDCVLRAPFDGDIGERWVDPGAFVRPGDPVVSLVDRKVVRYVVDVPESEFGAVVPGTAVALRLLAVPQELEASISRRSPAANPTTRTIHVEVDLPDPERRMPVNTTAEMRIAAGTPIPAASFPLTAADIGEARARLFTVADSVAHARTVPILGEIGGELFVEPQHVHPGDLIVLEGRAALADNDRVAAKELAGNTPLAGATNPVAPGAAGHD